MRQSLTFGRTVVAVLVALLFSVIIWFVVPYNNFWLNNNYLSDDFLPVFVVAFLLLMVLAVNPLLKLIGQRWMFDRRQMALIAAILLFASVIPSNGLMRMYPRFVARSNQEMNASLTTAKLTAQSHLPKQLFPDKLPTLDKSGHVVTKETPASNQFMDELDIGGSIPWAKWVAPMIAWGLLFAAMWAMMLGMAGAVFPQWRDRERLPFPLLNVYHGFIGELDEPSGNWLPAVFRSKSFWIAAGAVFFIHALRGLNTFTGSFPSFPLEWHLTSFYSDSILRNAPVAFKWQCILFSVVGIAYFIPNRYAVSIWAWIAIQGWYITLGRAYIPAFNDGQVTDQSFGALLAIAFWVLWLGRSQWARVGRAMLGRASGGGESRRDAVAGWMFALGCVGIVCWLDWAGCSLWWSVLAMLGCAFVSLVITRIIAETGIPVLWISQVQVSSLAALFPLTWQSPATLYFGKVFYAVLTRATAVSAAVMATMALGMDREAGPKYRARLLPTGLMVLLIGFVICGGVQLYMGYHHATLSTQAKMSASVMDQWAGAGRVNYHFFSAHRGQQAIGFSIAAALLWACSRFPAWPIHPVGILFCQNSIGNLIWFSVFLGWLIKVCITGLFGGGAYRKARPLFLGLIVGELLAIIVWTIVPVVMVMASGADPSSVPKYLILRYP